jgi:hypothetical protein
MAVPYGDLRAYEDRLNLVVESWSASTDLRTMNDRVMCIVHLTIGEETRPGVGESLSSDENATTVAYAQAFKRACSAFRLGRYLYDLPQTWVPYDEEHRRISDEEIKKLDTRYSEWLRKWYASHAIRDPQNTDSRPEGQPSDAPCAEQEQKSASTAAPLQAPSKGSTDEQLVAALLEQTGVAWPDALPILRKLHPGNKIEKPSDVPIAPEKWFANVRREAARNKH